MDVIPDEHGESKLKHNKPVDGHATADADGAVDDAIAHAAPSVLSGGDSGLMNGPIMFAIGTKEQVTLVTTSSSTETNNVSTMYTAVRCERETA